MEGNANKYSFVWKKSTEKYQGKLREKVKALLDEVQEVQEWEGEVYGDRDLNEVEGGKDVTSEDLQYVADKLNEVLRKEPGNRNVKLAKKAGTGFIPWRKKYEHYETIFEGRIQHSNGNTEPINCKLQSSETGRRYRLSAAAHGKIPKDHGRIS